MKSRTRSIAGALATIGLISTLETSEIQAGIGTTIDKPVTTSIERKRRTTHHRSKKATETTDAIGEELEETGIPDLRKIDLSADALKEFSQINETMLVNFIPPPTYDKRIHDALEESAPLKEEYLRLIDELEIIVDYDFIYVSLPNSAPNDMDLQFQVVETEDDPYGFPYSVYQSNQDGEMLPMVYGAPDLSEDKIEEMIHQRIKAVVFAEAKENFTFDFFTMQ